MLTATGMTSGRTAQTTFTDGNKTSFSLTATGAEIASFANRVGALVASRHGAIPDWSLEEAVKL